MNQEDDKMRIGKYLGIGFLFCLVVQVFAYLIEIIIKDLLLINNVTPARVLLIVEITATIIIIAIGYVAIQKIKSHSGLNKLLLILVALYFIGNILQYYYVMICHQYYFFESHVYIDASSEYMEHMRDFKNREDYFKLLIDYGPWVIQYLMLVFFFIRK